MNQNQNRKNNNKTTAVSPNILNMNNFRRTLVWKPEYSEIVPTRTPSPRKKRLTEKIRKEKAHVEWQEILKTKSVFAEKSVTNVKHNAKDDAKTETQLSISQEAFVRKRKDRIEKKRKINPFFMGQAGFKSHCQVSST